MTDKINGNEALTQLRQAFTPGTNPVVVTHNF